MKKNGIWFVLLIIGIFSVTALPALAFGKKEEKKAEAVEAKPLTAPEKIMQYQRMNQQITQQYQFAQGQLKQMELQFAANNGAIAELQQQIKDEEAVKSKTTAAPKK